METNVFVYILTCKLRGACRGQIMLIKWWEKCTFKEIILVVTVLKEFSELDFAYEFEKLNEQ